MNNFILISLIVSLLLTLVGYISTNNYIIAILIFVLSLIYSIFRLRPLLKKYFKKVNNYHLCYLFTNNLIISISIFKNVEKGCTSALESIDKEIFNEVGDLSNLSNFEKSKYLSKVFSLKVYDTFLSLLDLYMENGGDILNMSSYIISQIQSIEGYLITTNSYIKRKAIEFSILWLFSLAILVFLRFALSNFFPYLIKSQFYVWGIFLIFLFIILSIELFAKKIVNIDFKKECTDEF
ncbi:MAG: hypothetical protein ACI31G_00240 [Bacilli bacterium]